MVDTQQQQQAPHPSPYPLRQLSDVCAGDHICCLCQNDEEKWKVLGEFFKCGHERKEKLIFFRECSTEIDIVNQLENSGFLQVRECISTGQFSIKHYSEVYLLDGIFDPNKMVSSLSTETAKSVEEGYPNIFFLIFFNFFFVKY